VGNCRSDQRAIQGRLVSVGEASKILAVSGETIRNWCDAGELEFVRTFGGHRRVGLRSIRRWLGEDEEPQGDRQTAIYCRCSTSTQTKEGNLDRQKERLLRHCESQFQIGRENILVISETGSGLNESRKGYQRLIELVLAGKLERIVVEHRDRIARFGTTTFALLCERMNVELIVTNMKEDVSDEIEMASDIMSLVTVYSARLHGKRGGEESRMVLTDEVKKRILDLYQQGLAQTKITVIIRNENFRCPKTDRKYAIHAVRQTIHQQEKILKALPASTSPIDQFIEQNCIRSKDERVFTRPFHREYSIWCEAHDLPPVTSLNLTNSLKRMFKLGRTGSGYAFINGIALKDHPRASRSHLG
jgi:excisionase family DNA binding protein